MDETHELLLAIAGRVDDDLLAWARELVAVGEDTRAVELVTAGLSADRVALPAAVRAALSRPPPPPGSTSTPTPRWHPPRMQPTDHRFTDRHDDGGSPPRWARCPRGCSTGPGWVSPGGDAGRSPRRGRSRTPC